MNKKQTMDAKHLKDVERVIKALANRRRLSVLGFLKKGEASVGSIADTINLSVKSTSRHLAVLFSADLVERRQQGLEVYYRRVDSFPVFIRSIISIL